MTLEPLSPKPADGAATLLTVWKAAQARLKDGRIDSPAIDARLLLEAAAGASRTDILTDPYRALTPDQLAATGASIVADAAGPFQGAAPTTARASPRGSWG